MIFSVWALLFERPAAVRLRAGPAWGQINRGELSEEEMKQRRERSMNDPAIQSILSDPIMTQVATSSAYLICNVRVTMWARSTIPACPFIVAGCGEWQAAAEVVWPNMRAGELESQAGQWGDTQVLKDLQENAKSSQHHFKNPQIMANIQKLVSAGIVRLS